MPEVLGKIEKPEVSQFKNGRKIFFVPLIVTPLEETSTITDLAAKYWREVAEQLNNLESKLSQIKRIYHELLPSEESVKQLAIMKIGSHHIVESLITNGAVISAIEDDDIMREFLDWNLCLSLQLQSPKVFSKLYASFQEIVRQRNEHIAKCINDTLEADEKAVLFMREGHHVQFPSDVQVFYVAPPTLDILQRTLREQQENEHKQRHDGESSPKF
ncbi:MAG: hypothetical protein FWC25_00535 [Dehalococcoidia bacterium]|nr:hypothetical protein [Dehalococcoidia bacterium]